MMQMSEKNNHTPHREVSNLDEYFHYPKPAEPYSGQEYIIL